MNQDVFRFVMVGAPPRPAISFHLRREYSSVIATLISLNEGGDGRGRLRIFARDFLARPEFVGAPAALALARPLDTLLTAITAFDRFELTALATIIEEIFDLTADRVVASMTFRTEVQQLGDGVLALLLEPSPYPTLLEEYVRLLRAADLIVKVAEGDSDLQGLRRRVWAAAPLELPEGLFPLTGAPKPGPTPTPTPTPTPAAGEPADASSTITALHAELGRLDEAHDELMRLSAADLEPSERADEPGRMIIRSAAIERLREPTRALLSALGVTRATPARAIERLEAQRERLRRELARATAPGERSASVRVGTTTVPTSLLGAPAPSGAPEPAVFDSFAAPNLEIEDQMWSVGSLLVTNMQILAYEAGEIAHIENVLIGEVKERETRRLRRTEETTILEVETTKEEERDLQTTERLEMLREVQNTIRESQQFTVGGSVSAGYGPFVQVTINTQYATDSSAEEVARNASNYAREITERTAEKITERVREEQTRRVIQEFEERNLHRLDGGGEDEHIVGIFQWVDKLYHAQVFDYGTRLLCNVCVPEPARFLLRAVLAKQLEQASAIEPPEPLDFGPAALSPSNYREYVERYEAKGVNPPPEPFITVSAVFENPSGGLEPPPADDDGEDEDEQQPPTTFTATKIVTIPSGYRAVSASVTALSEDAIPTKVVPYGVVVLIGPRAFDFIHPDDGTVIKGQLEFALDDEVGSVAITLMARYVTHYVVGVEILCQRTTDAIRAWQVRTYEALLDAYLAREAEYHERLAEAAAREGIVIEGRNPLENRRIERAELQRLTLSMITRDQLGGFGSYEPTAPVPLIDFDAAEEQGRYIKFFTNAFEWENMAYELYAYFWTDRKRWADKLLISEADPLHAEFLRAGEASVRLAVRPGYEAMVFHFLNTGELWNGGALPPTVTPSQTALITKVLTRRLAEDIHERIPVGEPWEVRLPTDLVRVAPSSALPRWEQDEDGNWHPVEQSPA